jgi:hypothetical protein
MRPSESKCAPSSFRAKPQEVAMPCRLRFCIVSLGSENHIFGTSGFMSYLDKNFTEKQRKYSKIMIGF